MRCQFIPPYLIDSLARGQGLAADPGAARYRRLDDEIRQRRAQLGEGRRGGAEATAPADARVAWQIHNAKNGKDLPGQLVLTAGQPATEDQTVTETATGLDASLALYADLGRNSYDDAGASVIATVHYEKDYDNAFWDGTQLVFGDGDRVVFERFTKAIDVLGHELSHAVTQYAANLTYRNQSGALNESMSDVFGSCVKQRHLNQTADQADWLVGEGIFVPGINGQALRSMKAPGTAYDDPKIGKDPQVGHMADYIETTEDEGGVHMNSGIPNKAFYLAATAMGGMAWERAGRIWYAALTSGIKAESTFVEFAQAVVAAAGDQVEVVRQAWVDVGVLPKEAA